MENVRGLLSTNNGKIKDSIIAEFSQLGYNVTSQIICAADYGVPQKRFRLFFMGIRKDMETAPSFPEKAAQKTNTQLLVTISWIWLEKRTAFQIMFH